jgi:hypothetical protein
MAFGSYFTKRLIQPILENRIVSGAVKTNTMTIGIKLSTKLKSKNRVTMAKVAI